MGDNTINEGRKYTRRKESSIKIHHNVDLRSKFDLRAPKIRLDKASLGRNQSKMI